MHSTIKEFTTRKDGELELERDFDDDKNFRDHNN